VPPCIAFYDRLTRTMCLCLVALSCSRCDVVNPTLQIRRIGCRSAVALSSPMRPITADAPVSDVRHQHRSYTNHTVLVTSGHIRPTKRGRQDSRDTSKSRAEQS